MFLGHYRSRCDNERMIGQDRTEWFVGGVASSSRSETEVSGACA